MPKVVVLIGAPGAGKSVQAEIMSKVDGWRHISTGELLRSRRPDLAEKLASGELIDSADVQATLVQAVEEMDPSESIVLDGFPRTARQAEWLDGQMKTWHRRFGGLIELYVDEEVTIDRLSRRGRPDDNEETLRRRLEVYEEETRPVIDYYQKHSELLRVDGVGTVKEVHQRIKEVLA
jgi:adenylate kinase